LFNFKQVLQEFKIFFVKGFKGLVFNLFYFDVFGNNTHIFYSEMNLICITKKRLLILIAWIKELQSAYI